MAGAGTVYVDVRAETTGFVADIRRAVSGLEGGRGVLLGAAAGTAAVTAGLGLLATSAIRASTEFSRGMSGVGAVANATAADLGLLREAALQAGADTAFSATEAAQAQAELAKAGISVSDILGGALTGTLDLAAAGQLDLGEAAIYASQALNVFGLEGDQASRVADVLAAGAVKSAADVGQLGQAMQQGALVAKQTGLTLEDTVGVLSLFADNALVGSDAGTSLKTMLQRLVPTSTEARDAMADLGLSFFDAQGQFVGIEQVAGQLQTALSGLSTEQRQNALTTIFGADAIRAAGLLYEGGAAQVRDYVTAVSESGVAQQVAAVQLDNLAGDLEELSGSWETLLINLGSSADTGLRDIVQRVTEMVNELGGALDSPEFEAFADGIGRALAAIGDRLETAGEAVGRFFGQIDSADVTQFFATLGSVGDTTGSLVASGFEVAGTAMSAALNIANALSPVVEGLADGLGVLADNSELVTIAFAGFAAVKLQSVLAPIAASAIQAGQNFAYLSSQIGSIAATQGVSRLEALRRVIGSSANEGVTGALTAANAATVVFTAAIAGSLITYSNWRDAQDQVKQATEELTAALLEQGDVQATQALARQFTTLLDENDRLAANFAKTGLSISQVTKVINSDADGFASALDALQFALDRGFDGAALHRFIATSDDVPESVRPFISLLAELVSAGVLTQNELLGIVNAMERVAGPAALTSDALAVQAQRFKEEAEGARLSADAQRNLATALDDNASLQARRDAIVALADEYPDMANEAGIATDAVSDLDGAQAAGADAAASYTDALNGSAEATDTLADAARTALDDVLGLLDAQDAYEDAIADQSKARAELARIQSGQSEALTSAREQLADAERGLTEAIEENAQAVEDAADRLSDAQDRLAEAREKGAAQGEGGVEGTLQKRPDLSIAREIGAAQRAVAEAQREYDRLAAGDSDQLASARNRVADAQTKVAEETAKVGPASDAAREAQERLEDANRRVTRALLDYKDAQAQVSAEEIPLAVSALQGLGAEFDAAKSSVDELIGSVLILGATIPTVPPLPPIVTAPTPTGGLAQREGVPARIADIGRRASLSGIARREGVPSYGIEGRAFGGPVDGDGIYRVSEFDHPETFTDGSGRQFLIPGSNGTVTPLGSGGDMGADIRALASEVRALALRPNEVRIGTIEMHGIDDGNVYAKTSRALADAGFKAR